MFGRNLNLGFKMNGLDFKGQRSMSAHSMGSKTVYWGSHEKHPKAQELFFLLFHCPTVTLLDFSHRCWHVRWRLHSMRPEFESCLTVRVADRWTVGCQDTAGFWSTAQICWKTSMENLPGKIHIKTINPWFVRLYLKKMIFFLFLLLLTSEGCSNSQFPQQQKHVR